MLNEHGRRVRAGWQLKTPRGWNLLDNNQKRKMIDVSYFTAFRVDGDGDLSGRFVPTRSYLLIKHSKDKNEELVA